MGNIQQYGDYQILQQMSSDSSLYSAMHKPTGKLVALRVMPITVKDLPTALADCKQLLHELIQVNVPNGVILRDFGSLDNQLYLVTDLMRGGTLLDRMRMYQFDVPDVKPRLPSAGEVLDITENIVIALHVLHLQNIVHGQIEPRSIFFDERGKAYLGDIGQTRLIKIIYSLDMTNSLNMSRFSAPELWDGQRPSPATDQYSLACILYQLLTGKAAHDAPSIWGLMQAHLNDVVTPPHYVNPALPPDLAMVFWQALAKEPDRRYPTIQAFFAEFRALLSPNLGMPTGFTITPLG